MDQIGKMVLHPAPSTLDYPAPPDNASCTTAPWQKKMFCTLPPDIWKLSSQIFQHRLYFLKYVVLKIAKLGPNLFPYRWDTLYYQNGEFSASHFCLFLSIFLSFSNSLYWKITKVALSQKCEHYHRPGQCFGQKKEIGLN